MFSFLLSVIAYGCAKSDNKGGRFEGIDDPHTSGGESSLIVEYTWQGLNDFSLKISDESCIYEQVKVFDNFGLFYNVTIDDSNVEYGVMGEYIVEFSAVGEIKEATVRIYDAPIIEVSDKTTFTYEEIIDARNDAGLLSLATAKDSFDNEIPIAVEDGEGLSGLFGMDGSVEYGDYDIKLVAMDPAGQVIRESVSISIVRNLEAEPTFMGETPIFDVVDTTKTFNVSLKGKELALASINGIPLKKDNIVVDELNQAFTVDLTDVNSFDIGNENYLRIMTSGGYTDINFIVEDAKPALMDITGRENQIGIVGDTLSVVQPRKVSSKQKYDIKINIFAPDGSAVEIVDDSFVANKAGVYTLDAIAQRDGVVCGSVEVKYTVYHAFNSFNSQEERGGFAAFKSVYFSASVSQVASFSYGNDMIVGDKLGDYMYGAISKSSYLGFSIPTKYSLEQLKAVKAEGISEIFTSIYIDCASAKSVRSTLIKVGALDAGNISSTESYGSSVKVQAKTWTKLSIPIDFVINNYNKIKSGEFLFFNIYNGGDNIDTYEENLTIYFSQFLFELPE